MDKPLRILVVVDLPWDIRLGATRVWMELAEQWRAQGHVVEKYSLSDAFPEPAGRAPWAAMRRILFPRKAAAFIKKNASRFDVIDCLVGTLPMRRARLAFNGLLVARSVGLNLLYERFEQFARHRWPRAERGTLAGRVWYSLIKRRLARNAAMTIREADLINLPNEDELACFRAEISPDKPVIVQPYGLTEERRARLQGASASAEKRWRGKKISFVGMWSERKGARDWGEIVRRIRDAVPEARFAFFGTMTDELTVLRDLGLSSAAEFVEIVAQYDPDQLPQLLSGCAVGAFPSYIEGFGLGVLEQLAAGLPTVAYDAPGARTMLKATLGDLLVPAGNTELFARRISGILLGDLDRYQELARRSLAAAERFSWATIARETLQSYRAALDARGSRPF